MREECEEKGQQRGERDERGAEGERSVREKWGGGGIKGEGGERRLEGHKRKGTEGWVKGEQPGIVGPAAVAATSARANFGQSEVAATLGFRV